ncbi:uroporphyrinogen-III synthase [Allorhizobium undicola]|uniref:uroporphyrinogen-III synthase n=1 Tax=Allorhizobium undicola TaxID=78527 RepID=UPI000484E9F3|nr:uroporphyrinogen-III synthase [Allorhizobium undicola]
MRVLITRTEQAGAQTAGRLAAAGHEPVLLPLAAPRYFPQAALAALSASAARQQRPALALTSTESLRSLALLGKSLHPFLDHPVFAVGASTARAAKDLGFTQVRSGTSDGQALAGLVAAERPDHLLYLAGSPRAKGFERGLHALGIAVQTIEIYEMQDLAYSPDQLALRLSAKPIDAVLLYSAESARRFRQLPLGALENRILADTRYLCLSKQVAGAMEHLAVERIFVAQQPDEASLLSLL